MIIVRSPRNGLYAVLGRALLTRDAYRIENYTHFKDDTEKLVAALGEPRLEGSAPLCVQDIQCNWGQCPSVPSTAMTLALYNRTVCTDFKTMLQMTAACTEKTVKLVFVTEAINLKFPPEIDTTEWAVHQTFVPTTIHRANEYPRPRSYDQLKMKIRESATDTVSLNARGSTSVPLFLLHDLVSSSDSSNSSTGEPDSTRV